MSASLSEPSPVTRDLGDMTKAQLLEYANAHGVTGVSGADRKAEIIEAIENHVS